MLFTLVVKTRILIPLGTQNSYEITSGVCGLKTTLALVFFGSDRSPRRGYVVRACVSLCVIFLKITVKMSSGSHLKSPEVKQASRQARKQASRQASRHACIFRILSKSFV